MKTMCTDCGEWVQVSEEGGETEVRYFAGVRHTLCLSCAERWRINGWPLSSPFRPFARPSDLTGPIKALALGGLITDGSHHKQWYLEKIFRLVGGDETGPWEPGIAP
jgi:hypothetical protein